MSDVKSILQEVHLERSQQPLDFLDRGHMRNDWVALIAAYSGRAGARIARNEQEDFRKCMIKVAALAVAAVEAYDNGWC